MADAITEEDALLYNAVGGIARSGIKHKSIALFKEMKRKCMNHPDMTHSYGKKVL